MSTYVAVFAMVMAYVALVAAYLALRTLAKLRRSALALSATTGGEALVTAIERTSNETAVLAEQLTELRAYVDRSATATANGAEALAAAGLADAVEAAVASTVKTDLGRVVTAEVTKQVTKQVAKQVGAQVDARVAAQLAAQVEHATAAAKQGDQRGALRNVALVRYDAVAAMSGRMSFSLALLDDAGDGVVISAIAAPSDTRVYAKGVAAGSGAHELSPEEEQAIVSAMRPRRAATDRKAG